MKAKIFIALFILLRVQAFRQPSGHRNRKQSSDVNDTIRVASWNIKWISHQKAGDPEKGPIIADTIALYDIIAIQEIRDSSDRTMTILQGRLLAGGHDYDYRISPLLPEDSSYKERYAFMFNKDTNVCSIEMYTFPDPDDKFVSKPLAAHFKSKDGKFDFVIVNIHTQPGKAAQEMTDLKDAIEDAEEKLEESDIITLGRL